MRKMFCRASLTKHTSRRLTKARIPRVFECRTYLCITPAWGATCAEVLLVGVFQIAIRAPVWGATHLHAVVDVIFRISIHTPVWARRGKTYSYSFDISFQSTRPHGARQLFTARSTAGCVFQSTRPAWGRDTSAKLLRRVAQNFNPHAPHGGATT